MRLPVASTEVIDRPWATLSGFLVLRLAQRLAATAGGLALGGREQAHARDAVDGAGCGDGRLAPVDGADGLRHAARSAAALAASRRRSAASRAARRRSA